MEAEPGEAVGEEVGEGMLGSGVVAGAGEGAWAAGVASGVAARVADGDSAALPVGVGEFTAVALASGVDAGVSGVGAECFSQPVARRLATASETAKRLFMLFCGQDQ
ncbi:MAG TPA: hypothetical protein VJX28_10450 [Chthoniobacterales bacterium]|nr:hypothetical protein [Chthoniobacterales bacterium]